MSEKKFCNKCGQYLPVLNHHKSLKNIFSDKENKICHYCGHPKLTREQILENAEKIHKYLKDNPKEVKKLNDLINSLMENK